MKDILGREIHDGDICVGKGTGRDVCGMDIGVWYGNSITFRGSKRSMRDVFLVVNPSEEELRIANEINENKKQLDARKAIPLGKMQIGGVYEDFSGYLWMYLGKRKTTLYKIENGTESILKKDQGHCFMFLTGNESDEEILKDISKIITNVFSYPRYNFEVLKGNKKLVKLIRNMNLNFPIMGEFITNFNSNKYRNYHYKLIVE